jgi:hypothetical protein
MALQGPFVVVADNPAEDVVAALRAAGAFPIIETSWTDAAQAVAAVEPEALVLADADPRGADADTSVRALTDRIDARDGAFMPMIARVREGETAILPDALAITSTAPAERIVLRLNAALRVRALHTTVLRRMDTLAGRGETLPELPDGDPLDDATVLVAGRGRSYPALAVAIGEQVGLVGALSVESAARALNSRDVDGLVIADGFGPSIVTALLTVLAEDARFCDLPVAVLGGHGGFTEGFAERLPNLERIADGPARLVERFLPYVRVHAFAQRLKRMLKSLDAKGMIDPDTGLLAHAAFWRDLNHAVDEAEKRGVGLSIARFSFERRDRRSALDAARLVGRLMRQVDFACREADDSIFAVFTETDLRAAHVIARRIASVLKHTMLTPDAKNPDIKNPEPKSRDAKSRGVETTVTLATLKPSDTTDSLIARVTGGAAVTPGKIAG